jgi:D-arabinose 5-phosphate isomerase GutQ
VRVQAYSISMAAWSVRPVALSICTDQKQTLSSKGVTIISVTEKPDSAIAQAAQLVIRTGVENEIDPLNMLATTSIVLVLAIFDAACACLMGRSGYSKETLLTVHPGGDVGKSLREED